MDLVTIIECFYSCGIIKFGNFILKDGSNSLYYIDLRLLISYPSLFNLVCEELQKMITAKQLQYSCIAGIPLAGIPIATMVSTKLGMGGLLIRKEVKEYGCKKAIEGVYYPGDTVLLIDDVVTSAVSKKETIAILEDNQLSCTDIVVIIDRRKTIEHNFIHSLMTIKDIVTVLLRSPLVTQEDREKLLEIQSTF